MPIQNKKKLVIASIDTSPERTYIEIDGKDWGCVTANEMGLRDLNTLQRIQRRFNEDFDQDTEEGSAELSAMMDKMVRIILYDMPDNIHKKLRDFHRMQIIRSFTLAGSQMKEQETNPPIEPSSEESEGSSVSSEVASVSG